jgi:hypothetical protein
MTKIVDYIKIVIDCSHNIPMNEFRKNKKLTSDISVLVVASNTGDISMLDKNDQDIIKNIVK